MLLAEDQNGTRDERTIQMLAQLRVDRPRQIDPANLRAGMGGEWGDRAVLGDRHECWSFRAHISAVCVRSPTRATDPVYAATNVLRGDPQASHRLATLCSQAPEKRCRS